MKKNNNKNSITKENKNHLFQMLQFLHALDFCHPQIEEL
jgi:hypothetical protein